MSELAPRISVVLPFHNGMPYLPETVDSVLAQTFADFELLLIDDGSDDESTAYARSLGDPRIAYHRLEKCGLVGALNHGLEVARAPLIARIDADDVAFPGRLARQHDVFVGRSNLVLLGCNYKEIDHDGNAIVSDDRLCTEDPALRWQLLFEIGFLHPGVIFPRDAALQVGGYQKQYDVAEDYGLWTRLAALGAIANTTEDLMYKRVHANCVSIVHRNRGLDQSGVICGDYAGRVVPGTLARDSGELYLFYKGRRANAGRLDVLCSTFEGYVKKFRSEFDVNSDELPAVIATTRRRLRWRCLEQVRPR